MGGIFQDKKIVMTGFRDPKIIDFIQKHNGTLTNSISKNIELLIIKDNTINNKKINNAKELDIMIMTKDEFYDKYLK
jgi:NAD-dependent DNA ligase